MTLRKWGSVKTEVHETDDERVERLKKKLDSEPPHGGLDTLAEDDVTGVIDLVTGMVRTAHKACTAEVRAGARANRAASSSKAK